MQRRIINGGWQDALGNPLALGYLTFRLNTDAVTGTNSQIVAGRVTRVSLDADGNIAGTVLLWPNDQLTPSGTTYHIKAFDSRGQFVWESLAFILPSGGSSYSFS